MSLTFVATALAVAFSFIGLGGGLYEYRVVDPFWPTNPALIQPARGGVRRVRFWLPAHIAFELCLIASLALSWNDPAVRNPLAVAFVSHEAMRLWSALDFIPKALAFEKAASIDADAARRWTNRSLLRLPLDVVTCSASLVAFAAACRDASGI